MVRHLQPIKMTTLANAEMETRGEREETEKDSLTWPNQQTELQLKTPGGY